MSQPTSVSLQQYRPREGEEVTYIPSMGNFGANRLAHDAALEPLPVVPLADQSFISLSGDGSENNVDPRTRALLAKAGLDNIVGFGTRSQIDDPVSSVNGCSREEVGNPLLHRRRVYQIQTRDGRVASVEIVPMYAIQGEGAVLNGQRIRVSYADDDGKVKTRIGRAWIWDVSSFEKTSEIIAGMTSPHDLCLKGAACYASASSALPTTVGK